VDRLRRLRDVLLPRGIELGLEFLGPAHLRRMHRYPFIHNLDGALDMIRAVGDGCGLVFDTFHWYCSGGTIEELPTKLSRVRIICVHSNDAFAGRTREQQLDGERALPLETGIIDTRAVLGILKQLDCDAPVIAEPFMPWTKRFKEMGVEAASKHVAQVMLPLMA
jgi:sugar phosphate isomerase/epimerase